MSNKKIKEIEDTEYGVDSRYTSKRQKAIDGAVLMEARLKRMKNLSEDKIIETRLLQLKFRIEELLNSHKVFK